MEIKRIRLKDDDVIQVGDTWVVDDVEFDVDFEFIGFRPEQLGDGHFERAIRPLAEGEVIREGDCFFWDHPKPTGVDYASMSDWGRTAGNPDDFPWYRPVRMQSEGWRYLDEGEIKPKGYGFFAVTGKWIDWPRADNDGTIVGDEGLRYRVPWPPREKPLELTDNSAKPFAVAETCIGTLVEGCGVIDEWKGSSCIYCDEPNDETMGVVEDEVPIYTSDAHARCAQKASRLQTPKPEPLHCTEQWGEEFEQW